MHCIKISVVSSLHGTIYEHIKVHVLVTEVHALLKGQNNFVKMNIIIGIIVYMVLYYIRMRPQ